MHARESSRKFIFTIILYTLTILFPRKSEANAISITISGDTSKKESECLYDRMEPLLRTGKVPFYGTWSDYFSSYLKINPDSTFKFSWGFDGKGSWSSGKWEREKDTFSFRIGPGDQNIRLNIQKDHMVPDRLVYYKHKLFLIDSAGQPVEGKIPSPYMGRKNRMFRTFYFREKRFNKDYFDSTYYNNLTARRFKMGAGINVMLQPVQGYRVSGSFGFTISPRYIFDRKRNSYLSLGLPLTTGFSRLDDSLSVDLKLGTLFDIPLILNYNYNWGTVEDGGSRLGYFFGGGVAYHYNHYTAAKDNATSTQQVNGFGPVVNAGLVLSGNKYRVRNMELKFSYMKMLVASKSDIFGIGIIVNF